MRECGIARRLRFLYDSAKFAVAGLEPPPKVDPRAVFANNELDLSRIQVYGFDYDYTLAVYKTNLNELIYNLAMQRLIHNHKYPSALQTIAYDPTFAIRGLHFDINNSVLLKVDAFSQIQKGTLWRGKKQLSDEDVHRLYGGFSLLDSAKVDLHTSEGRTLRQLIDLFSLPWAGLLSTATHYFDEHNIVFDPQSLFNDVAAAVDDVHRSGDMYAAVRSDLPKYIHLNLGLKETLARLHDHGKLLCVVTNSPFAFINAGMTYMLGADWRRYFAYVVVSAKKPHFFNGNAPFRLYNEEDDSLSYQRVTTMTPGCIYAGGNIAALSEKAGLTGLGVLYFGDHIYADLADPMLRLGWNTAAIVPELAREIRIQNSERYRQIVAWLETLTALISQNQAEAASSAKAGEEIAKWMEERTQLRLEAKAMFNPQFGSIFRTYHNMTTFSRRLLRLSDVYTSRFPNLLKYEVNHTFYPRRNALPHEIHHSIPSYNEDV